MIVSDIKLIKRFRPAHLTGTVEEYWTGENWTLSLSLAKSLDHMFAWQMTMCLRALEEKKDIRYEVVGLHKEMCDMFEENR